MSDASHELVLYTVNDGDLYRQRVTPMLANLRRKIAKGTYNRELAVKLWLYLAEAGAKKYAKEFATPSEWSRIFPPADRREAAKEFARYYEDELGLTRRDRSRRRAPKRRTRRSPRRR